MIKPVIANTVVRARQQAKQPKTREVLLREIETYRELAVRDPRNEMLRYYLDESMRCLNKLIKK